MITARYHREIPQRYRLEAAKCSSCGEISFPPRIVCAKCKAKTFEKVTLSDVGTLQTFTIIRVASDKFSKETPFAIGIIELENGVKLTAQIADVEPEELTVGKKVRLTFRKIQEDGKAGILCYGYKAVVI
ncbi:MAG: Zn-ribbon domain-containing OB-fold protein [Bacteroidetes bacterium]|nr:MAG: Zn-ribbon domain-containing OB-fold protein [Bacteroidota bacterium]